MNTTIDTLEKSKETETPVKVLTAPQLLLKATVLSLLFVAVLLFLSAIGLGIFVYAKFNTFLQTADLTQKEVQSFIKAGVSTDIPNNDGVTTFLLLGLDTVPNKAYAPSLTDTIMLVSLQQNTGEISTISLPRDLWSKEYRTKINALYVYGDERYPGKPELFSKQVIEEMTGVPVDYTIVISLEMVSDLVNALDGVTINVPHSFTDTEFPRTDIDISKVTESSELYESISFEEGVQRMNGEMVLKYIRSRHSAGDTGTDLDRNARQQLVLNSVAQTLIQKETLTNPILLGNLYKWYEKYIQSSVPEHELVAFAKILYPFRQNIQVHSTPVTIYPDDPNGIIEHPPIVQTDNQWVYVVKDSVNFQKYFKDYLIGTK